MEEDAEFLAIVRETFSNIDEVLQLSTAHITRDTADRLQEWSLPELAYEELGEYGWFFYARVGHEDAPEDLKKLLELADTLECRFLILDRDCETLDSMEVYEW